MTISWAGGNDYCTGSVKGFPDRFYIERTGPQWIAIDLYNPGSGQVTGRTMREAQEQVEALYYRPEEQIKAEVISCIEAL